MTDANDILMGSGAPAAKFDTIGTTITGTVLREPEARQQKDFRTQVPETWPDGSPKMQVIVQIKTDQRDPDRGDDDGTRIVYIKGKELTNAVRNAVRTAGANGIHTGGRLTIRYTGDGPAEKGLNAPKLYDARYEPPAASFDGVTSPAAQPATQQAQPAQQMTAQQYAQPALGADQPLQCPDNVDPLKWLQLSPEQQQKVVASLAGVGAGNTAPPF